MFRILSFLISILLILTGCGKGQQEQQPFIFSYEMNKIEPEHSAVINEWLTDAKNSNVQSIYSYETPDGYKYSYLKGYKDVEVSFIYSNNQGQLKQRFIKGNENDEVFVQVKYNTSICCHTNIYETDDNKDIE